MRHDLAPGGTIGTQLVGDEALGRQPLLLQQPGQQSPGGLGVATYLDDFIQNVAALIDGAPQPALLLADANGNFVEVPHIAGGRRFAAQLRCDRGAVCPTPSADRS